MLVIQYDIYKQIRTVKCDVYVMLNICYLCYAKIMYYKYIRVKAANMEYQFLN